MHRYNEVVAGTCGLEEEEETCICMASWEEVVVETCKLEEVVEETCSDKEEMLVVGVSCVLVEEGSKLVVGETCTYRASWVVVVAETCKLVLVVEGTCTCRVS